MAIEKVDQETDVNTSETEINYEIVVRLVSVFADKLGQVYQRTITQEEATSIRDNFITLKKITKSNLLSPAILQLNSDKNLARNKEFITELVKLYQLTSYLSYLIDKLNIEYHNGESFNLNSRDSYLYYSYQAIKLVKNHNIFNIEDLELSSFILSALVHQILYFIDCFYTKNEVISQVIYGDKNIGVIINELIFIAKKFTPSLDTVANDKAFYCNLLLAELYSCVPMRSSMSYLNTIENIEHHKDFMQKLSGYLTPSIKQDFSTYDACFKIMEFKSFFTNYWHKLANDELSAKKKHILKKGATPKESGFIKVKFDSGSDILTLDARDIFNKNPIENCKVIANYLKSHKIIDELQVIYNYLDSYYSWVPDKPIYFGQSLFSTQVTLQLIIPSFSFLINFYKSTLLPALKLDELQSIASNVYHPEWENNKKIIEIVIEALEIQSCLFGIDSILSKNPWLKYNNYISATSDELKKEYHVFTTILSQYEDAYNTNQDQRKTNLQTLEARFSNEEGHKKKVFKKLQSKVAIKKPIAQVEDPKTPSPVVVLTPAEKQLNAAYTFLQDGDFNKAVKYYQEAIALQQANISTSDDFLQEWIKAKLALADCYRQWSKFLAKNTSLSKDKRKLAHTIYKEIYDRMLDQYSKKVNELDENTDFQMAMMKFAQEGMLDCEQVTSESKITRAYEQLPKKIKSDAKPKLRSKTLFYHQPKTATPFSDVKITYVLPQKTKLVFSNYTLPVPNSGLKIISSLRSQGFSTFIFGGFVRDNLLAIINGTLTPATDDIDIATAATPMQITKFIPDSKYIPAAFPIISKEIDGISYDLVTFRRKEEDGQPKQINQYGSLETHLEQGDFTINVLAYDIHANKVYDYYHGIDDLKNKIIRTILEPNKVIQHDPVVIWRALRLAAQLNFTLEESLSKAIKTNLITLFSLPKGRQFTEFMKCFGRGFAARFYIVASYYQALKFFLPALKDISKSCDTYFLKVLHYYDEQTQAKRSPGISMIIAFFLGIDFWQKNAQLLDLAANEVSPHQLQNQFLEYINTQKAIMHIPYFIVNSICDYWLYHFYKSELKMLKPVTESENYFNQVMDEYILELKSEISYAAKGVELK